MKFKIAILSVLALGATALTAFSQAVPLASSYTATTLTMPNATLAAGGSTNIASGWSTVTSLTNVATGWNTSSNAVISTTNVTYVTNTSYLRLYVTSQKECLITVTESAGVGTNTYAFAPDIDTGALDTNNVATLLVKHTAAGTASASTNLPSLFIGGAGGVRVLYQSWAAAADGLTNGTIRYGKIVGAK